MKELLRKEIVRLFKSALVLSAMTTDNNAFNLIYVSSNAVGGAITSSIKKRHKEDLPAENWAIAIHHHNRILLVTCHFGENEA